MTTASRSLATALGKARVASGLLRPSYTITRDTILTTFSDNAVTVVARLPERVRPEAKAGQRLYA
jgi:hypothetical protein